MNAHATQPPPRGSGADDDMPAEIDFANGVRGKFHRPDVQLRLPIYLEEATERYLTDRAQAKGTDVAALVNQLLKKDIELIEAAR